MKFFEPEGRINGYPVAVKRVDNAGSSVKLDFAIGPDLKLDKNSSYTLKDGTFSYTYTDGRAKLYYTGRLSDVELKCRYL